MVATVCSLSLKIPQPAERAEGKGSGERGAKGGGHGQRRSPAAIDDAFSGKTRRRAVAPATNNESPLVSRCSWTLLAFGTPDMSRTIARLGAAAACAASLLLAAPGVPAQSAAGFPGKPMHIVVTFTPGGAPDILARLIGDRLATTWGQPVLIDNKPGAGGNTGADFVAKAPPDGLTIVVGTVGTHAINGALYAKMPYDMVKDFAPITLLATTPNLLVDQQRRAGEDLARVHRPRQARRQDDVRVVGVGHLDPRLRRAVQDDDRDRHDAHPVQGPRHRDSRCARRQGDDDVRQHAVEPAAGEGGEAPRARRDERGSARRRRPRSRPSPSRDCPASRRCRGSRSSRLRERRGRSSTSFRPR